MVGALFISDEIMITKLHAPIVGVKLMGRPRLLEVLKQYASRKLILVTAPAGYGKTVLISQFTSIIKPPTTWYQLDVFDNDFALFVQHLLAGLERFLPGIVSDMRHLTQNNHSTLDEAYRISVALVNSISSRLEGEMSLALAIDDYHVIREDKVHRFMEQLIYYLPENVHVFLSSRVRPPMNFERLKVAGLMEEIDLEDLRFNREEITAFLINEMNEPAYDKTVTFLEEKTGGWPAALRLAVIAMSGGRKSDISKMKSILPNQKEIYHYLASEVLRHLPDDLAKFVLSTSVLDIMTPQICNHFMEIDDSKSFLEELEFRNLFITAMKGEYQVYIYHPLFKDFLQKQLKEKQKKALLQRGGHAYIQSGYLSQSIECFLSAGDYSEALSVLESAGSTMLRHNRWQTIKRWMKNIPAQMKKSRPRTLLLEGVICLNNGNLNQAEKFIDEAASALDRASDKEGGCQLKLVKARIMRSRGDYEESLEMLELILPDLALLPVAEWYDVTLEHSLILLMQGEFAKARNLLEPALSRAEHEGEMHVAAWLAERLGILYYFMGDYSLAVGVQERAGEMAPEQDHLAFSLGDSMAAISYDWGDLDQALHYAQNSIKIKERLVIMETLPYSYCHLAFILAGMNQPEAAEEKFLHSIALSKKMEGGKFFLALTMAFYSSFLADRGRIKEAISIGDEAVKISSKQSDFIFALCTEMAATGYIKSGKLREGASMLHEALDILERIGARYFMFYGKAFLASIYRQQNKHAEAEKLAEHCLDLAGSENYLQFFVTYREMMLPVVRTGLIKGQEPDFIDEIFRRWGYGATDLLSELSRHNDPLVRERVINAMALIKDKKSFQDLERLLDDPHEKVRNRALAVFSAIQKVAEPENPLKDNDESLDRKSLSGREESIKVLCLGSFQVIINNKEVNWRTNKARELFAYLFHCRAKPVLKDKIMSDLWPDSSPEKASALFHTNLYHLRKAIKPYPGKQLVIHKDKKYCLNKKLLSADIDIFKALAGSPEEKKELRDAERSKLEEAESLYRGDYMEDIDCQWVGAEREQMNQLYLFLLERLAHHYLENGEFDHAVTCLRTILRFNPLLENIHISLMKAYSRMGDRLAVMQQYQTLSRDLEEELGIKPGPKTRELYYELCSEEE